MNQLLMVKTISDHAALEERETDTVIRDIIYRVTIFHQ